MRVAAAGGRVAVAAAQEVHPVEQRRHDQVQVARVVAVVNLEGVEVRVVTRQAGLGAVELQPVAREVAELGVPARVIDLQYAVRALGASSAKSWEGVTSR